MSSGGSQNETVTTTVTANDRGDVRIPAEVRKALEFEGKEAILEITVNCKKIVEEKNSS